MKDFCFTKDSYEIIVTPHGTGQSSCSPIVLNRWSGDRLIDEQGFFLFVRDTETGVAWSATPKPCLTAGIGYEGFSVPDKVCWSARHHGIGTRLQVGCASRGPGEVRQIEVTNHSARPRTIDVTSFLEVVLHFRDADANHPAFQKLFVQTEWDAASATLLAHRRPRGSDETWPWMIHRLEGAPVTGWETCRLRFIGRGRDATRPLALEPDRDLTNTTGNVLDACFSLRTTVALQPGEVRTLAFLLGIAETREDALGLKGGVEPGTFGGTPFVIPPVAPPPPAWAAKPDPGEFNDPLHHFNGYGGFSEDGTEYVIRMPWEQGAPRRTPLPWSNCIANQHTGVLVTESGSACTWARNSQANRLTPWSNDPVSDPHGEAFYLRDEESGQFWSPLPGPAPAPVPHEVRHGWGYSTFRSTWDGLASEVTFFVPVEDPVRIVQWRLSNHGSTPRRVSLFGYGHLVLGSLPAQPGALRVRAHPDLAALSCAYPDASPFRERRVVASASIDGAQPVDWHFTCDREAFLGQDGGGMRQPAAVRSGQPLGGECGVSLDACFAQQMTIVLAPRATVEAAFFLGECDDHGDGSLEALLERYRRPGALAQKGKEVREAWRATLGAIKVKTPLPGLDVMLNGWLGYQAISSRIIARTAFYQSSGAFGFRDQLQDAHGLALLWPALTREQILRHARRQFTEGDVMHWWHPEPIDRGLRTRFSDDLLWLPYVTISYVEQTGDVAIWDEQIPYLKAPVLAEQQDEAYLAAETSGESGTLYDHCCRAIDRSLAVGSHGLPLMGTGDWNDGMNRVGRLGRGESVWMAFFLVDVLRRFLTWCERRRDAGRIERYAKHAWNLAEAVQREAWDGNWYRRAYYDDGTPLGTASAQECRIDSLAQSWAVISAVAGPERAARAMQSAWDELVDPRHGVVRLLAPPFADCKEDPGYIKGYVAGVRENGGQYTHAACWFAKALALLDRREEAVQVLEWLTPVWHTRNQDETERYMAEPYVVAADVYHGAPHTGRGGWTWYTGSAAWLYRVSLETVFGFSISGGDEAILRPRIPASWPAIQLRYRYGRRGTIYEIEVHRDGEPGARLDGKSLELVDGGVRFRLVDDGLLHSVAMVLR